MTTFARGAEWAATDTVTLPVPGVAASDGSVRGGHWWEAHVSIIAEIFVTEEEGDR
jgi:hypothetical protein